MSKGQWLIQAVVVWLGTAQWTQAVPLSQYNKKQVEAQNSHPDVEKALVIKTQKAGGYLFMKLKTPAEEIWAATTDAAIDKGDHVAYSDPLLMEDFKSKSLGKTFKKILFISKVRKILPENKM